MMKYKLYSRKSSFKKDKENSQLFLKLIQEKKPKNFLEVGVLQGVTARNICEMLNKYFPNNFKYVGIDLFDSVTKEENDKEFTPIHNKISNPFKNFYFNYILRVNLNSYAAVEKLLKKFKENVTLHKGYSSKVLNKINLEEIDFVFLDGGHSYKTVKEDLNILLKNMKKNKTIICDDYNQNHYGVKQAVDEINKNKFKISILNDRFAEIIT